MRNNVEKLHRDFGSERDPRLEFENAADSTGMWFAAAVLCAFLTAGVIVYRTGNSDVRTASNEVAPAAALSSPIDPGPILPAR